MYGVLYIAFFHFFTYVFGFHLYCEKTTCSVALVTS
uniref:Uncharacterized protein n=1 Tax=Lepeophtheirus salmonis TaxID=72036 RepID=A0A0K2TZ21_LEPSM